MPHACETHSSVPEVEIEALSFSEQFLVWAVRAWVDGYKSGKGRAGLLREGFALAGAADGWLLVEELMSILAAAAKQPLDVRCLACRTLGEDEAPLLAAIGGLQQDDNAIAVRLTERWLPAAAARAVLSLFEQLAVELQRAGMRLPARHPVPTVDRGLALVH
ncbi:MAG: hypothetical protein FJX54_03445 [Alphaproteobacteria bacterium]|nr:hypothetical protein [Alphaproteobacteria bacterium]